MRVVVTGGAGFVGSAVVRMLIEQRGAAVLNLDRLVSGSSLASLKPVAMSPRYTFRKVDVCDRERVAAALHAFAPTAVVHAAFDSAPIGPTEKAIETNVLGTWRALEAVRDYWSTLPLARQETFRFLSVSALADDTSAADDLVAEWRNSYGLPTIGTKAAAAFGPRQFPRHAMANSVIKAIDAVETSSDGEPAPWIYIDDYARALLAILEKGTPGATYGISGKGHLRPDAVIEHVRQLVGHHRFRPSFAQASALAAAAPLPALVEPAGGHSARLAEDTGWRAEESADTALAKTVQWYLANETWWRPLQAAAAGETFGVLRIA